MNKPERIKTNITVNAQGAQASRDDAFDFVWRPLPGGDGSSAVLHLKRGLHGTVESVSARVRLSDMDDAFIFMNGYQTWTYCPEYTKKDRIKGLNSVPQMIVDKFALDRYGDYHFVDYPNRKGVLHGESYCYFRTGDRFLLFASLDEKCGYTMFRYYADEQTLSIRRDCEGLEVDGEFDAFRLFIAEGTEDAVFDAWFREMGVSPITSVPLTGYSSWYNRYQNISEESIMTDLNGCGKVMRGGELFQIDDGWETHVGDWLECDAEKFPNGMKAVSDAIHQKGYKAGIWLAPFVAEKDSKLYAEHPDWFYTVDGEPWCCGSNWGGFYSLDIDKPEVVSYIESSFKRVFDEWGFDLVKLDFLYGAAPFGSSSETRAARMIRAMKLLRRVCGSHPILGCGVPLMPAFGLVEYCRISCDVSLDWDDKPWMRILHRERVSTRQAMRNTVFRRQLNGRAFMSDPDVFFLREKNIHMSKAKKLQLASINALFGGVFMTSDNIGDYDGIALSNYRKLNALRSAAVTGVAVSGKTITVTYTSGSTEKTISFK
ncbi:MAG: alpha-galactosidase [Clostridiales bacterium]|nr:alpha-galactosidase [Clostridiales bacterium]